MSWVVSTEATFDKWFAALDETSKEALFHDLAVLEEMGPQLGRPFVDTLGGSRHSNMKELRTEVAGHVFRCAFAFDLKREARVLVGDDKRGKDQKRFYEDLIKQADGLFDAHLAKQRAQIAAEAAKKKADEEAENKKRKKRRPK